MNRKLVIAIYSLMSLRILVDPLFGMFLSTTLVRMMELVVLFAIVVCFLMLYHRGALYRFNFAQTSLLGLFGLYSLFIVARGDFSGGLKEIFFAINGDERALPYLMPFVILLLPNRRYSKEILNVFYWSAMLSFPLWLVNAGQLVQPLFYGEKVAAYFPYFAAFMLCFWSKLPPHRRLAMLAVYAIYLVLMIMNARRNVVASMLLYGVVAFVTNFKWNTENFTKIVIPAIILIAVGILNFPLLKDTVLKNFIERMGEDTRSNVEMFMLADFATSPVSDTIFGRGMDGTYFQENFVVDGEDLDDDRSGVETGYLNFVLKGGVIYAVLLVIISIVCIVRGFIKSNAIPRALPLLLVVFLLDFYMSTPICFMGAKLIIYWFSVACCLQKRVVYVRYR